MNQFDIQVADRGREGLNSFWRGVSESMDQTLAEWGATLPKYMEAVAVFFIGVLLGYIIEYIFWRLGERFHLEKLWKRTGVDDLLKKANIKSKPTHLAGQALKGVIIMYFLRLAAISAEWDQVSEFIADVLALIPSIFVAIIVMLFAVSYAGTAASLTQNLLFFGDKHVRKVIATLTKNLIIAFGLMIALSQFEFLQDYTKAVAYALLGMMALAGGLALGLGGQDFVRDALNNMREHEHDDGHKKGKTKKAS